MSVPDVSVISCGHHLADGRLHRICAALVRAGLAVEAVALGDPGSAPPGVAVRTLGERRGTGVRARRALTLPLRARGRVVMTLDPDLVPAAAAACRLRGRRLLVDVHEDYLALLADRDRMPPMVRVVARQVARTATALGARADLCAVADDHLPPRRCRRRLVVRNLPDRSLVGEPGEPDPAPRAVYVGDVRRSRGLRAMLATLEAAPAWTLDIVGPVGAGDEEWLRAWRRTSPASRRVRLHGRLPPAHAWEVARGAWAGLALLEDTPAFRAALPTKILEYLAGGLAILATPLPRVAAIVGESAAGELAGGPDAAARVLRGWAASPALLLDRRAAARAWARRHLDGPSPCDLLAGEVARLLGEPGAAATRGASGCYRRPPWGHA